MQLAYDVDRNAGQHLLSDAAVQKFIEQGFLVIEPDVEPELHTLLYKIFSEKDYERSGNNVYPAVPQLHELLHCSALQNALTSILGQGYILHPHRHLHHAHPKGQNPHKDSYFGFHRALRSMLPRWAMVMYYPQCVEPAMGPTELHPGTQYYDCLGGRSTSFPSLPWPNPVLGCVPQGACVIMHYDLYHRATPAQRDAMRRFMVKFQFVRMQEPTQPSWASENIEWNAERNGHALWRVHEFVWRWMCGVAPAERRQGGSGSGMAQRKLLELRKDADEPARLDAAMQLALLRRVDLLSDALLRSGTHAGRRAAAHALVACGHDAVAALVKLLDSPVAAMAATALGEIAHGDAVPALTVLRTDDVLVRRACAEALHCAHGDESIAALLRYADDEDEQVRLNAALSLLKVSRSLNADAASMQRIRQCADAHAQDSNRYVRAYFVQLDENAYQHYHCPLTTPHSTF